MRTVAATSDVWPCVHWKAMLFSQQVVLCVEKYCYSHKVIAIITVVAYQSYFLDEHIFRHTKDEIFRKQRQWHTYRKTPFSTFKDFRLFSWEGFRDLKGSRPYKNMYELSKLSFGRILLQISSSYVSWFGLKMNARFKIEFTT